MGDKLIRQNVSDELDFVPTIDSAQIGAAVGKGIVTLTGHVASDIERATAEEAAQTERGVRGMVEEIKVRFDGAAPPRDEDLPQRAAQMLDWSATVPRNAVQVTVKDAKVVLQGKVDAWHQHRRAENAAWWAPGMRAVEDRLTLG
ncbi:BON domain-containing protein [Methylobacterium sp. PvR107]|uniref:BON domain-containing protein n=1 Tax=Methylobacterium sp. PvR107 TaxID=2806597 RepID=UPI001AE24FBC|nr:BON domain-containing protein [Methylobacterium sp. PvR107]MBP1179893.1 osmotically-inducible protein OsmY [Methylobacterium sp. PvR107]